MLRRMCVLMTHQPDARSQTEMFVPEDNGAALTIEQQDWEDMGRPDEVTIIVTPGPDEINHETQVISFESDCEVWLGDSFESWLPSKQAVVLRTLGGGEMVVPWGTRVTKLDGQIVGVTP